MSLIRTSNLIIVMRFKKQLNPNSVMAGVC